MNDEILAGLSSMVGWRLSMFSDDDIEADS